jgi:hypothetical protein
MLFTSVQASRVAGVVTDARNGLPVPGATVTAARPDSSEVYQIQTDIQGYYEIEIGTAFYRMKVEKDGYIASTGFGVELDENEVFSDFNFQLQPLQGNNTTVKGTVTDGESGNLIPDAVVYVTNDINTYTAFIAGNDSFLVEDISPGLYSLLVSAPGYKWYVAEDTVFATEDSSVVELNAGLEQGEELAVLTGKVETRENLDETVPVSGALVSIFYQNAFTADSVFFETVTSEEGLYRFENIPAGFYNFACSEPAFERVVIQNTFINDSTEINLVLDPLQPEPPGTISGMITFEDSGDPVDGAKIAFIGQNGDAYFTFSEQAKL